MRRAIQKYLRSFLAIIALFALALGVAAYILANQRLRFPVVEEKPLVIRAELEDAQAVTPGQGQTVRVAGVEIGAIGKVEVDDGIALVDMEIEPEYKGLIRADATVLLRPKTALKDMLLEVDPGEGRPLGEGDRIPVANTAPDIDPDEIFSALDADTRDYLRLLISAGGKGLNGRGEDLRQTLRRLEPLHRDLAAINAAIAERRVSLKRLIHDYSEVVEELGGSDDDLARLVTGANDVFSALAAEDANVSATVRKLPGTLRQTERTLTRVDALGGALRPALNALRPPLRRLDETNAAVLPFVREAAPIVRDRIRPFARRTQPFVADLGSAADDTVKALPDLTTTLGEVNRFFNIGAYNPGGAEALTGDLERDRERQEGFLYWLAWTAQNGVSLFNTSDANGPFRRLTLCGVSVPSATRQLSDALSELVAEDPANLAEVPTIVDRLVSSGFGVCNF